MIYTDKETLPDVFFFRCIINGGKKQNLERHIIVCEQRAKYMYVKLKYILNIYINYIYNLFYLWKHMHNIDRLWS